MSVAAITGQPLNRLGHESGAETVLFSHRFCHELEETVLVGCVQRIIVFPVHFKLAVGILMVVLIRTPAQLQHIIANLGDHIIAAHHRLLVIAWLGGGIVFIRDLRPIGGQQEKFGLNPGFDAHALIRGPCDQFIQHVARGLFNRAILHHAVTGNPGNIRFPRQLDNRSRVRNGEHIRVRGCQVQPGGKAGKSGAFNLHARDGLGRDQLGALIPEQVGE